MVRAQVMAWSERRSQGGPVVVVIMGKVSSRRAVLVVGLSRADHTDTDGYAPVLWLLAIAMGHPRGRQGSAAPPDAGVPG